MAGFESRRARAPWTYWLFAGCSLIWNTLGAVDYTLTELRNPAWLGHVSPQMLARLAAMPGWLVALWALGVWASLAGSLLLLARRRQAVGAFALSFIGAAGSYLAQALRGPGPGWVAPAMILLPLALQWGYARRSAALGRLG